MNKEEISWVVGEAIHFAYEVGYLDCLGRKKKVDEVNKENICL